MVPAWIVFGMEPRSCRPGTGDTRRRGPASVISFSRDPGRTSSAPQVNLRLAFCVRPSQNSSVCVAFFLLLGSRGLRTSIGGAPLLRNMLFRVCLRLCRGCSRFRDSYYWGGHVFLLLRKNETCTPPLVLLDLLRSLRSLRSG